MKIIDLPIQQEYFEKDQQNQLGARLAKFDLEKGDILRFWEVDKNDQRTGRYFDRKIKNLHRIQRATKYWTKKDLTKYGFYIFVMEDAKKHS